MGCHIHQSGFALLKLALLKTDPGVLFGCAAASQLHKMEKRLGCMYQNTSFNLCALQGCSRREAGAHEFLVPLLMDRGDGQVEEIWVRHEQVLAAGLLAQPVETMSKQFAKDQWEQECKAFTAEKREAQSAFALQLQQAHLAAQARAQISSVVVAADHVSQV